jgi:hypothetical protein
MSWFAKVLRTAPAEKARAWLDRLHQKKPAARGRLLREGWDPEKGIVPSWLREVHAEAQQRRAAGEFRGAPREVFDRLIADLPDEPLFSASGFIDREKAEAKPIPLLCPKWLYRKVGENFPGS